MLPFERPGETVDIGEERRLFYVGLTRGRQKLVLTHARRRVLFGRQMENPVSRFVNDIAAALKDVQEMQQGKEAKKSGAAQLSLF